MHGHTDIKNTNCCLCSASWRRASTARYMYRLLIHNNLNTESVSFWFYCTYWYTVLRYTANKTLSMQVHFRCTYLLLIDYLKTLLHTQIYCKASWPRIINEYGYGRKPSWIFKTEQRKPYLHKGDLKSPNPAGPKPMFNSQTTIVPYTKQLKV
jgi:hypothetical protein